MRSTLVFAALLISAGPALAAPVTTAAELVDAVASGGVGDTVVIAPGTYTLTSPLQPKQGMTLLGTGAGVTIITNDPSWTVGNTGLPDNAVDHTSVDRNAYLIDLGDNTTGVTVSNMTLTGPGLHGAIYGNNADGISITCNTFDDFVWSSVRLFRVNDGVIAENEFIDAGGRAGVTSGVTGGAIFITFTNTTDIHSNRFTKTPDHPGNFFGIKGRKATDVRIFDNTINVSFSIEFPFENDFRVEIFNNYLDGVVSIPKFAGGPEVGLGDSYDIYNNYFDGTYSIEGPRNGMIVRDNLFDFPTDDDGGNLITCFGNNGSPVTPGPMLFTGNLVRNPGRGVFWSAPIQNNATFTNNHIVTNTTATPRTEGLFGIKLDDNNAMESPDLSSITIADNIIEMNGLSRPLVRGSGSNDISPMVIVNNTLVNVSDTANYPNTQTGAPKGPASPLSFRVGVGGEFIVDGFTITAAPTNTCAADFNANGEVDLGDFTTFANTYLLELGDEDFDKDADFNQNGVIDLGDFTTFANEYLRRDCLD